MVETAATGIEAESTSLYVERSTCLFQWQALFDTLLVLIRGQSDRFSDSRGGKYATIAYRENRIKIAICVVNLTTVYYRKRLFSAKTALARRLHSIT